MRKIFIFVICIFVGFSNVAIGENILTTQSFVDSSVAQKQDKIPANNGATQVLMNTGTDGSVGTKDIYDSNASYSGQSNALIDATTMNAAVQNAIDNEFECIQYDANNECLLVRLIGAKTLPNGYTALEYLESTGTQYLDLGQPIGSGENITTKFEYINNSGGQWFGATDGTDWRSPRFSFTNPGGYPLELLIHAIKNTNLNAYYYRSAENCVIGTKYILNWYGTPHKTPTLYPSLGWSTRNHESYTPARNAYLFKENAPNFNPSGIGRSMRIYYFRVEGKMDLVPARRDSDGVIGMYDVVNGTFLTNAGYDKFIAGPVVYLPQGN